MDTMAGTLTELLQSQSRALPDHEAIVFPGSRTTYAGLVARDLPGACGEQPGYEDTGDDGHGHQHNVTLPGRQDGEADERNQGEDQQAGEGRRPQLHQAPPWM